MNQRFINMYDTFEEIFEQEHIQRFLFNLNQQRRLFIYTIN